MDPYAQQWLEHETILQISKLLFWLNGSARVQEAIHRKTAGSTPSEVTFTSPNQLHFPVDSTNQRNHVCKGITGTVQTIANTYEEAHRDVDFQDSATHFWSSFRPPIEWPVRSSAGR